MEALELQFNSPFLILYFKLDGRFFMIDLKSNRHLKFVEVDAIFIDDSGSIVHDSIPGHHPCARPLKIEFCVTKVQEISFTFYKFIYICI